MICLCYNKEKGLYIAEENSVKNEEIIFKSHDRKGFLVVPGKFELNKHSFNVKIGSNLYFGKAAYLLACVEKDGKSILNFNYGDEKKFWGNNSGNISCFYVDPTADNRWEQLFNLIKNVCKQDKYFYGSFSQYYQFLSDRIKKAEDAYSNRDSVIYYSTLIARDFCDFFQTTKYSDFYDTYKDSNILNDIKGFPELFVDFLRNAHTAFDKYGIKSYLPDYTIIRLAVKALDEWIVASSENELLRNSDKEFLELNYSCKLIDEQRSNVRKIKGAYYVCTNDEEDSKWELVDTENNKLCNLPTGYENSLQIFPSKETQPALVTFISQDSHSSVFSFNRGKFDSRLDQWDSYNLITGFSHGFAIFKENGKFGIVDYDLNIFAEPEYEFIDDFYSSFSYHVKAKKDGKLTEINLFELTNKENPDLNEDSVKTDGSEHNKAVEEKKRPDLDGTVPTTIKKISCENFKRFTNLKPLSISTINFIVGVNNAGKSTFIEIIKIFLDRLSQLVSSNENSIAELFNIDYDKYLSHTPINDKDIVLSITFDNKITALYTVVSENERKLDIDYIGESNDKNLGIQYVEDSNGRIKLNVKGSLKPTQDLSIKNQTISQATEDKLKDLFNNSRNEDIEKFIKDVKSVCTAAWVVNRIPAWIDSSLAINDFSATYCKFANEVYKETMENFADLVRW